MQAQKSGRFDLFKSLIVDEAGGIFRNIKLPPLNEFTEFPGKDNDWSVIHGR